MSQVVAALACSHSPLLTFGAELWGRHARNDRFNTELYDEFGDRASFEELAARNGERFLDRLNSEHWADCERRCQSALDAQAAALGAARPDVIVVVGDDQMEIFDSSIQPLIAIFHGEKFSLGHLDGLPQSDLVDAMRRGYAMTGGEPFPSHPEFALHLIKGLLERDVDVTTSAVEPDGRGFGHAYGFVLERLAPAGGVSLVPVMLNTFYPPNQPTPARCVQIGKALRAAISSGPADLRVALVASGGLSHFVVDESLDRGVLDAIDRSDLKALSEIPLNLLEAGSSEIRNWIVVAAAMEGTGLAVNEYVPCVRSEAGTGVGMGFATWACT